MSKYMILLLTALSLSLISAQANARQDCHSWWKDGVKHTKCYKEGRGYYYHGQGGHHHRYHKGHHEHHHGHHHGHHHHGHHHK